MLMGNTISSNVIGDCRPYAVGRGTIEPTATGLRLVTTDASRRAYSDAQLDDYQRRPRRLFLRRPPLTLSVTARFSHSSPQLRGTAGFGFWNDPFWMTGARWPALPRAIWFFYASPPSHMQLDAQVPGCGWKVATLDTSRPAAWAWLPWAPLAVLLMNLRPFYRALWPRIQPSVGVREALLELDMTAWHTYILDWGVRSTSFSVDGQIVLQDAPSPRGPLGLVLWLDNQYMVVTPWGRLGWGLLDAPGRQWMEVSRLFIT